MSRRGMFGVMGAVTAVPLLVTGGPGAAHAAPVDRRAAGPGAGGRGVSGSVAAGEVTIDVGEESTLVPPTKDLHQYPNSFAWEVPGDNGPQRHLVVGVNQHIDDADAESKRIFFTSTDGQTWQPGSDDGSVSRIQLPDSTLLGFSFYALSVADSGDLQAEITVGTSTDLGDTFTSSRGIITSDRPLATEAIKDSDDIRAKIFLHDRALLATDGRIYQPAYGFYADDTVRRSWLLVSDDRGATWTIHGTIANEPDLITAPFSYEGMGEPQVTRLADGSLYAVLRAGSWRPLYAARSTDDGATWGTVELIGAGESQKHIPGINPKLRLLPNGVLVLLTGRNLIRIHVAADGRGETWSEPVVVSGEGFESGNAGLEVLDDNRVVVIGDKRSNNRPGNPPRDYHIWSRIVTIQRQPLQRLDLAGGVARGEFTVTTNLTATDPDRPAVGPAALLDGYTEPARVAEATGGARGVGQVTVDLGSSRRLTHVGVGAVDHAQNIIVETSTDRTTWTQQRREELRGAVVHHLPIDTTARQVRVTVRGKAPAALSEIEVCTKERTFGHDLVGQLPYGFTGSDKVTVVDTDDRGRVLELWGGDTDGESQWLETEVKRSLRGCRVELTLKPVTIPASGVAVQLKGIRTTGELTPALNCILRSNGSFEWWGNVGDEEDAAWHPVLPAGTVKFGQWSRWVIICPTDRALPPTLSHNGAAPVEMGYLELQTWDFRVLRASTSLSRSAGQRVHFQEIHFDADDQ